MCVKDTGSDGKLLWNTDGEVLKASLIEKLMIPLLAKLSNFIPEGGIWLNTQRPEWNDANNALVGKGLSVVTLCYLRRFIDFFKDLLDHSDLSKIEVDADVQGLYQKIFQILNGSLNVLQVSFDDKQRRSMMDTLGQAGSDYRSKYYLHGFSGESVQVPVTEMIEFLNLTMQYVEHSLLANKRTDNLYHTYNILHLNDEGASIGHLYEMLEGQVAILSSGLLPGEESLELLESLRYSQLYRSDQHSYILYRIEI